MTTDKTPQQELDALISEVRDAVAAEVARRDGRMLKLAAVWGAQAERMSNEIQKYERLQCALELRHFIAHPNAEPED